jgi:hypothetical protein
MSTTRRITDQQFADDTAIDGSRVQKAMEDTEEYFNEVPIEAFTERYSLNYMVFTSLGPRVGFHVASGAPVTNTDGFFHYSPFLPEHVNFGNTLERSKGSDRVIDPFAYDTINRSADGQTYSAAYVLTASVVFPEPVILDSVSLFISNKLTAANAPVVQPEATYPDQQTDGYYQLLDGANRSLQRTRLLIDTDNVISAEDRTLNSKEYALKDFQELFWYPTAGVAPSATMFPETATSTTGKWEYANGGLYLRKSEINLPFHQMARVRFRVVLYGPEGVGPTALDKIRKIKPENFTFTIVYKEGLISG